ncbi:hypothetical protein Tco_0013507 [Tanacetum coccineum]
MEYVQKSINEIAQLKRQYDRRVNKRIMRMQENKVVLGKAVDADLVVMDSSGTKSRKKDTSNSSGNYLTYVVDADIRPHTEQSKPIYDKYLLEKSVENADLKAQIQEKVFVNATLKNKLRKLKGNSVDTKFAKASILGKPPLQPSRNHLVVRQPNAFKSERPRISKPRFTSQVDEKNVLSKLDTPHYLPNVREYAPAKSHHEARKKTQDGNRNLKPREMPSARTYDTLNACTPRPRSNNQTFRNWPASKSSNVKLNAVQKTDHSRNSSSFSDSKHFVCLTCQNCLFNANHDACVTKFLNEVKSRARKPSHKTKTRYKPIEKISNTKKSLRQILAGHMFSTTKSSVVQKKTNIPRSCLRWKPTGRIFKTVGLRWVPTGKIFTYSTTKVDSEPPNGSNDDITNPYECDQTLNVNACTLNLSAGTSFNPKKERLGVWLLNRLISQKPRVQGSQML